MLTCTLAILLPYFSFLVFYLFPLPCVGISVIVVHNFICSEWLPLHQEGRVCVRNKGITVCCYRQLFRVYYINGVHLNILKEDFKKSRHQL